MFVIKKDISGVEYIEVLPEMSGIDSPPSMRQDFWQKVGDVAAMLLLLLFLFLALHVEAATIDGKVTAILDGDTVEIVDASRSRHRVRLAGIDAPEKGQPFGAKSRQSLAELAFGAKATAVCDEVDRYGRNICAMTVGGINVNLEQVKRGLAWVYLRYTQDPMLIAAEREAKRNRIGLWADANPVPPWEWRKH